MAKQRTFILKQPRMRGDDVKKWQQAIKGIFMREFGMNCPIVIDGVYGPSCRSFSAELCHAMGLSAKVQMKNGVTPELREKLELDKLTPAQLKTKRSPARHAYRMKLREQFKLARKPRVHAPVHKILQDSWGYHPGVHDGLDVITQPDPVIFAMVKSKVIDVRSSGWWGLGAPSDSGLKAKGDGIIQLEVLETVGPFKKGMHIGYGHAEKARVKKGQVVEAGHAIGHAGFANAWHIHLMVNDGSVGTRGVGNRDPRPLLDYAVKNG